MSLFNIFFYFGVVNGRFRSRKRTRHPNRWKSSIKKQEVQKGQEHTSKSGRIIPAKTFLAQVCCSCRLKCHEKIDVVAQKAAYDHYYNLKSWSEKTLHIRSFVKKSVMNKNLNPVVPRYKYTCKYFLHDSNGIQQQVCLQFLSKCLRISDFKLKSSTKFLDKNPSTQDHRGKFPTRKYKETDLNFLREFIRSFPTYDSQYKISASNKQYLSPFLNIRRMYIEYELKCAFEKKMILPEWKFREIFNSEFNLSFHRPKM